MGVWDFRFKQAVFIFRLKRWGEKAGMYAAGAAGGIVVRADHTAVLAFKWRLVC